MQSFEAYLFELALFFLFFELELKTLDFFLVLDDVNPFVTFGVLD